jgi:hypothetical protein
MLTFLKHLNNKINYNYISVFLILLYFINSIISSQYFFDYHHNNLIFSQSSKFLSGQQLYKEVWVKYGIGEVLLNTLALFLFGNNIFSIFLIDNIFYFLSIFIILLICIEIKINPKLIFLIILIIINLQPLVTYPWANFLYFFPITLSFLFLFKNKFFLSGLFLASATLIRETVLISSIIIFVYICFEKIFFNKDKRNKSNLKFYSLGFFLPLIIFATYLFLTSNYKIWLEININDYIVTTNNFLVQKNFFPWMPELIQKGLISFYNFFKISIKSIPNLDFKIFLFLLIYIASFTYFFFSLLIQKKSSIYTIIAIYSMAFAFQAIHITEDFRLVTGSVLGILIVNYFLDKLLKNNYKILLYIFFLVLLIFQNLNFYLKSKKYIFDLFVNNNNNHILTEFKRTKYNPEVYEFYYNLNTECKKLHLNFNIKYSINETLDSGLDYFCKTKPLYYFTWTKFNENINYFNIFQKAKSINKNTDSNSNNTITFFELNEITKKGYKTIFVTRSLNFNWTKYFIIAIKD